MPRSSSVDAIWQRTLRERSSRRRHNYSGASRPTSHKPNDSILQSFKSLLKLAASTRNSLTKLTPLDDGGRYFHRLVYVGTDRSVWRWSMAALVGNLTSVWRPFDWTLLFARQPEPDLEFTEEELDQTITTKARGPLNPRKKPSGGSPILWVLLLALVGGIAYVSMEPELLTEWLGPYLGESTPPPPVTMRPKPAAPAPAPQAAPSPSTQAPAPLAPETSPATGVAPATPAVVPPPQTAARPAAPEVPPLSPMFGEGQKVTVTADEMAPGGSIPLFSDPSSSKPGPIVRPGASLTVMDGDLQPGGWMYMVRSDEGATGWVSEKRLRLKF
jgi:hypothetical protein